MPLAASSANLTGVHVVSDNGSSDGTSEWLAQHQPEVEVIQIAEPLSIARAVNLGIRASGYRRTLLLNNDMVAQPGFIDALNSAFDSVPDLFCATAQIFFPPGMRREETGKAVWRREDSMDFPIRCDDPIPGEDLTWVLYGSGGCSLYDTAKLRALGGMSEDFDPAYVEDLDLGYRAWKRGWPSIFRAGARVEHRHRATTSRYYPAEQLDAFVEKTICAFGILLGPLSTLPTLAGRDPPVAAQSDGGQRCGIAYAAAHPAHRVPPGPADRHPDGDRDSGPRQRRCRCFYGMATPRSQPGGGGQPDVPFPPGHGGAVRIYNLMKIAAEHRDQILIAFCDELAKPAEQLLDICREVILVRRRGSHYRRSTPRPDVVEEFDSEVYRAVTKQAIRQWRPGIVQLEFTQMAQYAADCRPVHHSGGTRHHFRPAATAARDE